MNKAFLILQDGTVFEGISIGAKGVTIGETVFTTGMTGYLETLTDPSYFGQIVTQTFPLIGNYGVIEKDFESRKSFVSGYIVRELCDYPSNFRCEYELDKFLKAQNIVGIAGIDTRELTKKLRESGVMNGMIYSESDESNLDNDAKLGSKPQNDDKSKLDALSMLDGKPQIDKALLQKIASYKIENAVSSVSTNEKNLAFTSSDKQKVVLWDFGAKYNIQKELEKRNCEVLVVPYDTKAEKIIELKPDGLMLSNGPGDPEENTDIIEELRKVVEHCETSKRDFAIFGICLGHQLLALAHGYKTSKLKYGHRGGNHPVKDLQTNRVFITSQNHGYAVDAKSLDEKGVLRFVNINDDTVEGIDYKKINAFSVQFHPEACGGPKDTNYLFDEFVKNMDCHGTCVPLNDGVGENIPRNDGDGQDAFRNDGDTTCHPELDSGSQSDKMQKQVHHDSTTCNDNTSSLRAEGDAIQKPTKEDK